MAKGTKAKGQKDKMPKRKQDQMVNVANQAKNIQKKRKEKGEMRRQHYSQDCLIEKQDDWTDSSS